MRAAIREISRPSAARLLEGTPEAKECTDRTRLSRALRRTDMLMAGYVDDELICIFGVIPPTLLSDEAYLWSYTFPSVKKFSFMFIRHSQLVIEELSKHYPIIKGETDRYNKNSIRWLKWLGAKFGPPHDGYLPFVIERAK